MLTLLLIIIYIAFISLGLPDAILGSAWPMIHQDLGVSVSYAGIITIIISGGTIISSLSCEKLIRRFGTGKLVVCSVFLTAGGLFGFYLAPGFIWLCLLGVPLGLGAGAIDSALNNFVALHYKASHMNWLHCFWGVGATAGPLLMSLFLAKQEGWRTGYAAVGAIQAVLLVCLISSLPLWKRFETKQENQEKVQKSTSLSVLVKQSGAKEVFISFFCYCGIELTVGLWGSSFLVISKGMDAKTAAKWVSLYYIGITVGRFLSGFVAMRLNNKQMMRAGQVLIICGAVCLALPFSNYFQFAGLGLIGLGCAPIFPAMLHETPVRFGAGMSQSMMGVQMAAAYVGNTVMPPVFGFLGKTVGFWLLPLYILALSVILLLMTERANSECSNKIHN